MNKRKFIVALGCLPLALALPRESHAIWPVLRFILGGTVRRTAAGAAARSGVGRTIINEVAKGAAQEVIVRSVMSYLARPNPQEMISVENMTIDGRKVIAIDRLLLQLIEKYGAHNLWFTDRANEIRLVGHNISLLETITHLRIYVDDMENNVTERQTTGGIIFKPYGELDFATQLIGMPPGLKRIRADAPDNPNIKVEPTEPFLAVQSNWVIFQNT